MKAFYHPKRQKDGVIVDQILSGGHMLAGGFLQDVHEQSVVQNYDIGTRLVMDDRVFRYCKAKGALDPLLGGRADVFPREGECDAVDYEVGSFIITIPMNQYGAGYVAEKTLNYWAEGYIWIQVAPAPGQMHRIKSSSVAAAGKTALEGGFVTLMLYESLKVRVPGSTWITAWANPYNHCVHTHSGRMSVVCQPLIAVPEGSYFWGQTYGPCFGQLNNTAIGRADNDRTVYFASDGSLMSSVDVVFTAGQPHPQKAGFLITNTSPWKNAGGGNELGGDQFYMLQLSP